MSFKQPKYKFLERVLNDIDKVKYYPFSEDEEVIPPNEVQPNSIIVFDDVACEKQDNMRAVFWPILRKYVIILTNMGLL